MKFDDLAREPVVIGVMLACKGFDSIAEIGNRK
jgi:hypothetical protein